MIISSTKLKNSINKKNNNNLQLEFHLKNIFINGKKRGCSGFIRNINNNSIVYVNTEGSKRAGKFRDYLYRYADNLKDYTGYRNRWVNSLEDLSNNILILLEKHVSEINEFRI